MNRIRKMVVALVAAALLTSSLASLVTAADKKWTCSRYVGGEYQSFMTVWASSYDEAMAKAREFYKDKKYDSIKCE